VVGGETVSDERGPADPASSPTSSTTTGPTRLERRVRRSDRVFAVTLAVAGAAALTLGVAAAVASIPALAVAVGLCGAVAAAAGLAHLRTGHTSPETIAELRAELEIARHEQDTLHELLQNVPPPPPNDELSTQAFDPVSGLLAERFLAVTLQQKVAAARRRIEPLALAIFEVDGLTDAANPVVLDKTMAMLGEVILRSLRECDIACRLGNALVVGILEATSEHGAVVAAERVRGELSRMPGAENLRVSAGIACYPSHALDAPELLARAGRALGLARSTGLDWVASA
jgi:diguanylate cyclase (GGDEF)-like protein